MFQETAFTAVLPLLPQMRHTSTCRGRSGRQNCSMEQILSSKLKLWMGEGRSLWKEAGRYMTVSGLSCWRLSTSGRKYLQQMLRRRSNLFNCDERQKWDSDASHSSPCALNGNLDNSMVHQTDAIAKVYKILWANQKVFILITENESEKICRIICVAGILSTTGALLFACVMSISTLYRLKMIQYITIEQWNAVRM